MKTKNPLFALFVLIALLLSACQINMVTEINKEGAGVYRNEFGFTAEDEAALAEFDSSLDDFCNDVGEDMPEGATFYKETRNKDETWCVFESRFDSIDGLKSIYGETETRINQLDLTEGQLTYDLSLDLSGDENPELTQTKISWVVKMPGKILESNATEQNGNTLTWTLTPGKQNDIRAVSEVGGINLGGDWIWYLLGGGAFLCLCCFVPLIIAGAAFFLIRRKKTSEISAS